MSSSTCTVSFFKNDLIKTRLPSKCPIKNCSSHLSTIRFQQYIVPFCPEHGIRIHKNGFVYCNGTSSGDLGIATRRNLMFAGDYYLKYFLEANNKMESGRLCYENSEDAVSYNVFASLLGAPGSLEKLFYYITRQKAQGRVDLYLWGNRIDLKDKPVLYGPLDSVRKRLEGDIRMFKTEPDIMLVVPKKAVICIEAKFGSKNPIAMDMEEKEGEKPKKIGKLIDRYCIKNDIVDLRKVFIEYDKMPSLFYEQIFRNIVFSASMAKQEGAAEWYVANLRNQHIMNMKRGQPESSPIKRSIKSMLHAEHKNRFTHLTWEDIYTICVKDDPKLANLGWYMKNKSLGCGRAFNIF